MARYAKSDDSHSKAFAERLREAFGDDSAPVISEKLGNISISTLNYWRRGDSHPDYEMLLKICNVYKVSADWLIGRPGASKTPEKGMEAACGYTGLSESAIRKIKENRFRRELEFILNDPNLEAFLKSFSRLSSRMYDLQVALDDIRKFSETGRDDPYVIEKTARFRDELDQITESIELSRFKVSETSLQTCESLYKVSDHLRHAGQVLEQLDCVLADYEKR